MAEKRLTKDAVIAELQSDNPDVLSLALDHAKELDLDSRKACYWEILRRMESDRYFLQLSRAIVRAWLLDEVI